MKRIAFFGGGFDPIHLGHISLAMDMKETHRLDEIYFCPAFCSPHKKDHPPVASAEDRFQMLRLAISGIEGFFAWDWEIQKKGLSYTIDTLLELQKKEKGKLHIILSEDALFRFDQWKDPGKIIEIAQPLVGMRFGFDKDLPPHFQENWIQIFRKGLTNTRTLEISSTEIRKRLKAKSFCGYLLPAKVLDYIHKNRLYFAS